MNDFISLYLLPTLLYCYIEIKESLLNQKDLKNNIKMSNIQILCITHLDPKQNTPKFASAMIISV